MRIVHLAIVVVSSLVWFGAAAHAEVPATTFTHIGVRDGLPGQYVYALAQDREGFMWFGTSSGLARFDGFEMVVYRHERGRPGSLPDDNVNSLYVDRMGRLKVATNEGLCEYDPSSDGFVCLTGIDDRLRDVVAIAEDRDGRLWIGGHGLKSVGPTSGGTFQLHPADDDTQIGYVTSVLVDSKDRIWIGTFDHGLFLFDESKDHFSPVVLGAHMGEEKTFLHDRIRTIYEDRLGTVWIGSDGGLTQLSPNGDVEAFYTLSYEDQDDPDNLSDQYVNTVFEDSDGDLWMGTFNGGLNRYDRATQSFRRYQPEPDDPHSLGSESIFSILQDRTGLMWFAGRGVDRLDLTSERLSRHVPPAGSAAQWSARHPTHLVVDSDGIVWLGSRSGLVRYDAKADAWTHHLMAPAHPDYPDNRVYSLFAGRDGFRYVGAPQSIWLFLTTRGAFGPSTITLPSTPSAIFEDHEGHLWVGAPFLGVVKFGEAAEPDQVVWGHEANDPQSLSNNYVHFFYEDSLGRFWVGTERGLNKLEPQSGKFRQFLYDANDPSGPSHFSFTSMTEGFDGELWLGTGRGLDRFDPETGNFETFTTASGLPHDMVNALATDSRGNIWIGTNAGLSRFEPRSGTFRNLYVENGLPDEQVVGLAFAPDGELFIATHAGVVSLRPDEIGNSADPDISVTRFQIFDSPVRFKARGERAADDAPFVRITHKDDIVRFRMAVFDYRDPTKNRYAHRLDGIDPDWVYTEGNQRDVSYTTLPAGDYTFRFKGMAASGRWHEAAAIVNLTVLPAPWLTAWAYLLYAAVLVIALGAIVALRTRAATQRARVLEGRVAQRTRELQEQTHAIERQGDRLRQVVAAKDRLYANVSHEFRTPLTVILGPVERLLAHEGSPHRRTHLEVIRRNAQRLLRLVEQLMTLARIDARKTLELYPVRISTLVKTLCESFRTLAQDKHISFRTDLGVDAWIMGDRDSLEKIVVNLLSNAVKYTPEGGRIEIRLSETGSEHVNLTVDDTGPGIPAAEQRAVFARFYRATDQRETTPGSGLGLALVKELVEMIDGAVTLNSAPGVGTEVRVSLQRCDPPALEDDTELTDEGSSIAGLEAAIVDVENLMTDMEQGANGKRRALVVEDNLDLCWHLKEALGSDLRCDFAHDGGAGVAAALETIPDIIVCDVMLPKLNGFEVTRRIKEDDRTSHIPVIMLTARTDEDSRLQGLQSLADAYITKPFNEVELRQRVETLLAIREILRQRFARDRGLTEEPPEELGVRDRRFLLRINETLEAHYADPDFSVSEFASVVAMSERQLQRKLNALTGHSPSEFIRNYRLERALEQLKAGEPAGTVAFSVGFSSQSYFTSCFKAQYGRTPGQIFKSRLTVKADVERRDS
jgi:signal transduction histidine kinase/ligand-binding sensor domain-containing protein/CheY-like chemotaxis protein